MDPSPNAVKIESMSTVNPLVGLCCTDRLTPESPCPRTDLSRDLGDGRAEGGEAVRDGDTDRELRDLAGEVPWPQALTRPPDAVYPVVGKAVHPSVF